MLWILRLSIVVKWIAWLITFFCFLILVMAMIDTSPKNVEFMPYFVFLWFCIFAGSFSTWLLLQISLRWLCQLAAASLRQKLIKLERNLSLEHPNRAEVLGVLWRAREYTVPPGWAPFGHTYEDSLDHLEKGYGHLREARRIARG
jgi:hypothetical protein